MISPTKDTQEERLESHFEVYHQGGILRWFSAPHKVGPQEEVRAGPENRLKSIWLDNSGPSVPGAWCRRSVDALPGGGGGWEGMQSQPEVGFYLIWGWFCSSLARGGGDSTKHVSGGNKNKMQSDLSCYMISKHCSVILHEAGIVSDFIERETLQDQRLGPSHTGV